MHQKPEGEDEHESAGVQVTFASVVVQILLLDVVFSLDSVITAVGMVNRVPVMVAAAGVMLVSSGAISRLIEHHSTLRMLTLAFLLLIGVTLVAEGLGRDILRGYIYYLKGYIYVAMAFSLFVEILNLRLRRTAAEPVHLHEAYRRQPERAAGSA